MLKIALMPCKCMGKKNCENIKAISNSGSKFISSFCTRSVDSEHCENMREILPAAENIQFCRIYQEFCMLKKFPNFSSLVDVGKFPGDLK